MAVASRSGCPDNPVAILLSGERQPAGVGVHDHEEIASCF
jgi:hypothetical protein